MRAHFGIIVAAALVALPAVAVGAPRTIDDCETIEAADTYNQCLALFGPPARSVRLSAVTSDTRGIAEAAPSTAPTSAQEQTRYTKNASRRHAGRDHVTKPRQARGEIVVQRSGRGKIMVFSVASNRTRLR